MSTTSISRPLALAAPRPPSTHRCGLLILARGATRAGNYDGAFAFLLGRYASIATNFNYDISGDAFAPGTGKIRDFRYDEYEVYAQDNWKMRTDLAVTFGLRWQYYAAPYEDNGFQAGNDVDFRNLFNLRQRNAANGVGGLTAEPLLRYDLIGKANNARGYYEPDLNNFAPRLSFAWNPSFRDGFMGKVFGDRKTVIRGGGSVVYERVGGALTFIQDQVSFLFDNRRTTSFGSANARDRLTKRSALHRYQHFTGPERCAGNYPSVHSFRECGWSPDGECDGAGQLPHRSTVQDPVLHPV